MAERFLVAGGTGNWNSTTNWSAIDGGASGASFPVAGDNVHLTAASGAASLTVNVASACANFDATGFTGTFAGALAVTTTGNWTWGVGMNRTFTGQINFTAAAARNITSNGIAWGGAVVFNNAAGSWQLQDAFVSTSSMTLTAGSFDTASKAVTCTKFTWSGAATRSLTLGSSTWTLTGSGAGVWNGGAATNASFSTSGSRIVMNGITAPSTFISGGPTSAGVWTYDDIEFSGGNSSLTFSTNTVTCRDVIVSNPTAGATFDSGTIAQARNINFTGFIGTWTMTGTYRLSGDLTMTVAMAVSLNAGSFNTTTTQTLTLQGKTMGRMDFTGTGTYVIPDATITSNNAITFQAGGTLDLTGKTINCTRFNGSGSTARSLNFTNAIVNMSGSASGTSDSWVFTTVTNLTIVLTGSKLNLADTTGTGKAFAGGGLHYPEVTFTTGVGGSKQFSLRQSNTFDKLTLAAGITVTMQAGNTQTFTSATSLVAVGFAGSLIDLVSEIPGTSWIFSCPENDVKCDYLSITDSVATGGARWWAGKHSTNGGGGSGWRFSDYGPRAARKRRSA